MRRQVFYHYATAARIHVSRYCVLCEVLRQNKLLKIMNLHQNNKETFGQKFKKNYQNHFIVFLPQSSKFQSMHKE
jgi:hypothetical protein